MLIWSWTSYAAAFAFPFTAFAAAQSEPGLTRLGCNVSIFS
jgi:hypothetical protein